MSKLVRLEYKSECSPRGVGVVNYCVFELGTTMFSKPLCVFTALSKKQTSSINDAEYIVGSICAHAGIPRKDHIFADLQTHLGYRRPSGFYKLDVLTLVSDRDSSRFGIRVENWVPTECPEQAFETFRESIGDFPSIEQVISRDKECYKDFSNDEFDAEFQWAKEHDKNVKQIVEKSVTESQISICSPNQAVNMGYKFDPGGYRSVCPPKSVEEGFLIVDLIDSHLIGQYVESCITGDLDQPQRFSRWSR